MLQHKKKVLVWANLKLNSKSSMTFCKSSTVGGFCATAFDTMQVAQVMIKETTCFFGAAHVHLRT